MSRVKKNETSGMSRVGAFFAKIFSSVKLALYNLSVKIYNLFPHKKRKACRRRRAKEVIFCYAILALPLFQFAVMYIGVNINSFLLAFKTYNIGGDGTATLTWVGLANFKTFVTEMLSNRQMGRRFLNSLLVYAINLGAGTVLAILFSYYVYKKFRGTEFFRVMLLLPSIVSPVVLILIYTYVADRFVPAVFGVTGLLAGKSSRTFFWIMVYNVFMGFGTGVLMYSNAMSRIPESLVESAKLDGITPLKEFFKITLPLAYPTIETFLIVGIANLFIDQANLFTFFYVSAPPELQTVGYYLFNQVFTEKISMTTFPYASAAGLTLTVITVPIVMIARFFLDKLDKGAEF